MARIWNDCVQAATQAFDISRAKAKLFVIGLLVWMGLMVLQTWFIWVGIIATAVSVLAILLILEWSLRAWYWVRNARAARPAAAQPSPSEDRVPEMPATRCADAQGRVTEGNLAGHDVCAMADAILRQAAVRKTWSRRPSWLRFPAICRAMPSLGRAGRALLAVCTR
ncbi:MAG: hypothetical protein WBD75_02355 [Phycisphaerae bacterium]